MSRWLLIDEFHLRFYVPPGLREAEAEAICRTLDRKRFHKELGRAVRAICRRYPALRKVQVQITR